MGTAYMMNCRKCGKQEIVQVGIGMLFQQAAEEMKHEVLDGEMGEELRALVAEHPEGSFDPAIGIFACTCGYWESEQDYSYRYFVDGPDGRVPRLWKYHRKCPKCRKEMHRVRDPWRAELRCRDCGALLTVGTCGLLWD